MWSVVYNVCEPNLFASGSDDCTGWYAISLYCYFLSSLSIISCSLPLPSSLPLSLPPFLSLPSSFSLISYCTVKLWCANRPHSIFSMGTKANVCCVRFRPANQYHMAYGSAGNPLTHTSQKERAVLELLEINLLSLQTMPSITWTCATQRSRCTC